MNSDRKRVIFDTSTLVSAFLNTNSVPSKIVQIANRQCITYVSQETFAELKEVIFRPKFDRYFAEEDVRNEFLSAFSKRAVFSEITVTVTDCPDPKDNIFLSLARSVHAHYLVSSDKKHLIPMSPYYGTLIVSPADFYQKII